MFRRYARTSFVAGLLGICTLAPAPAWAHEPHEPHEPDELLALHEVGEPDDWSLGVRVGVPWAAVGAQPAGLGGLGGLGSLGVASVYGAAVERRMVGDLWLRAWGGVGFHRSSMGDPAIEGSGLRWSGSVGARYAFFGRGPLTMSGLLMGFAHGASQRSDTEPEVRSATTGLGGSLGLAVEYELARGLYLRLESPLASVARWEHDLRGVSPQGDPVRIAGSGVSANLELAPALELRMTF